MVFDYEGIGRGGPLVLLHGGMGTREVCRIEGWLDPLADQRGFLLDARGLGRSETPEDQRGYTPA